MTMQLMDRPIGIDRLIEELNVWPEFRGEKPIEFCSLKIIFLQGGFALRNKDSKRKVLK